MFLNFLYLSSTNSLGESPLSSLRAFETNSLKFLKVVSQSL